MIGKLGKALLIAISPGPTEKEIPSEKIISAKALMSERLRKFSKVRGFWYQEGRGNGKMETGGSVSSRPMTDPVANKKWNVPKE